MRAFMRTNDPPAFYPFLPTNAHASPARTTDRSPSLPAYARLQSRSLNESAQFARRRQSFHILTYCMQYAVEVQSQKDAQLYTHTCMKLLMLAFMLRLNKTLTEHPHTLNESTQACSHMKAQQCQSCESIAITMILQPKKDAMYEPW